MTGTEIVTLAREDYLDDPVAPFLWSNNLLERYLNQAEREACRRASLLFDKTTAQDGDAQPLCSLSITAGTATYAVSSKIIRVRDCVPAVNGYPILQKTTGWLDEFWPEWRIATGAPVYFIQDKGSIQLVPIPVSDDTLALEVMRLPLADMTIAGAEVPEIPEEYHLDLVPHICELAFRKRDAETEDNTLSESFAAQFTAKFGPPVSALSETNRRRRPRNMRLRAKRFGFS
jgi:hypothetical protein